MCDHLRYLQWQACHTVILIHLSVGRSHSRSAALVGVLALLHATNTSAWVERTLPSNLRKLGRAAFIPLRLRAATMRLRLERSGASNLMARLRAFVKQAITCDDFVAIKQ